MDHLTNDYSATGISVDYVEYTGGNIPKTKQAFHDFPLTQGWKLDPEYKLEPESSPFTPFEAFLQSWLFFGLISTVVQNNTDPLLAIDDLRNGGQLNTGGLYSALERWAEWETSNLKGFWYRMIQVEYVLDKSRLVVRKNLGYNVVDDHVEYNVKPHDDPRYFTDENALCLMTVGELLSAVKTRIMKSVERKGCFNHLSGWHADDDHGWGPPRYVFKMMEKARWCSRAKHLLKGQLRSNATMLLEAYFAYKDTDRFIKGHEQCDKMTCKMQPKDANGKYINHHMPECEQDLCEMKGPDMEEIRAILSPRTARSESQIPLLQFHSKLASSVELKVTSFDFKESFEPIGNYTAISHVWADGWGNEDANKLPSCHLRFIRRQIKKVSHNGDARFWMDTLVIPVEDKTPTEREIKTKAIGQIFHVFQNASKTIILDNGLQMSAGRIDKPAVTAMKVLASGWMRRLWTLQEAFLSRHIYFAFQDLGPRHFNIIDLNDLNTELNKQKRALASQLLLTMQDQLLQNIMGHEQRNRDYYLYRQDGTQGHRMPPETAATLVANMWRAARWRTTKNPAHETLALATVLNLDYQGKDIEAAGLAKDPDDTKVDQLVKAFWIRFNAEYEGAIPAGIIFLSGEKVNIRGFGWAPRSWMSAQDIDYPDPLSRWSGKTFLEQSEESGGLRVKYPGFRLWAPNARIRRRILGTDQVKLEFKFPVDRKLLEWYKVKPADPGIAVKFLNEIVDKDKPLAIILSRPQPGGSPREIGLLVMIYEETEKKTDFGETIAKIFHCYIIRRIHICRETGFNFLAGPGRDGRDKTKMPQMRAEGEEMPEALGNHPHWNVIEHEPSDDTCIGEVVPQDQVWVVDGYPNLPTKSRDLSYGNDSTTSTKQPGLKRSATAPVADRSIFRRVFGGMPKNQSQDALPSLQESR